MYTNGILIRRAQYNMNLGTAFGAEFELWNIAGQHPITYSAWLSPCSGKSTIQKFIDGYWVDIFRGNREDAIKALESIICAEYKWTIREFSFYVAGWCDHERMK